MRVCAALGILDERCSSRISINSFEETLYRTLGIEVVGAGRVDVVNFRFTPVEAEAPEEK